MGIVIRTNHGTKYMYFLTGKSQIFLGKKDEPDNLNIENLRKGINMIDKTFDKTLDKYLKGVQEHAKYLPTNERTQYLEKRITDLDIMLRTLNSKI